MNYEYLKNDLPFEAVRTDFNIMTYYPPHIFEPTLMSLGKYHYIKHDKDGGEPHYHIALKCTRPTKLVKIKNNLDGRYMAYCDANEIEFRPQRLTARPCRGDSIATTIEYYLHTDPDSRSKDKHLYDFSEIQSNYKIASPVKVVQENEEKNEEFLSDLTKTYETTYSYMTSMAKKYGRDFIKNFNSYDAFRERLLLAEREVLLEDTPIEEDEYVFAEPATFYDPHRESVENYKEILRRKLASLERIYPHPEYKRVDVDIK